MLNWNKRHIGVVALLLCTLALPAMAQLDTGSIVGVVQDKSGALLPDSTVTVTNTRTARVYQVQTTGSVEYEVPSLAAGSFTVSAQPSCFNTLILDVLRRY